MALPPAAWASAVFVNGVAGPQLLERAFLATLTADALLYTAGALVVAAPLAGVVCASGARRGSSACIAGVARPLAIAVALMVATSAALATAALGTADALAFIASSHATIAAVALALAAFGAVCGALFDDPLDAAGCSAAVTILAAGGLLVGGAAVGNAPKPLLEVAMTTSPFVAMASAAHVDVVRMDLLYRLSPLAHLGVDYPAWYAACGWYLLLAAACFGGVGMTFRKTEQRSVIREKRTT